MASEDLTERVTRLMATLNRTAAQVMADFHVHACTDVTGFGLLGHLAEMVDGSGKSVRLAAHCVPVFPEAVELASMGLIPAGAYKNRDFRKDMVAFDPDVPLALQDILFDPQTSGGLLISVAPSHAEALLDALRDKGVEASAIIGEVLDDPAQRITVAA